MTTNAQRVVHALKGTSDSHTLSTTCLQYGGQWVRADKLAHPPFNLPYTHGDAYVFSDDGSVVVATGPAEKLTLVDDKSEALLTYDVPPGRLPTNNLFSDLSD